MTLTATADVPAPMADHPRHSSGDRRGQDLSWPFFLNSLEARKMIGQKFAVGQLVEFDRRATPAPKPMGPFEVLRVQPADDVRLRAYRIKSKAEAFERSAREYEIVAVADIPGEPQVFAS